jgi:ribosomal protein L29|tara:strand:- start:296 stop:484 length:189 start_codon:yes stop_codon:yes gene_type:complete
MKMKELSQTSPPELKKKLVELKKELIKHNSQIASGTTPKSPGQVKQIKKTIARINMVLGNMG